MSSNNRQKQDHTHPLFGADFRTLWHIWRQSGGVLPGKRKQLLSAFLAAGARFPFSVAESLYVAASLTRYGPDAAPIFIIGHWRSGTTHLYNILSKAPHFAYVSPFATALPWDFLLLARALAPLLKKQLPQHRYIDRIAVEPDSPQEDEIALANMTPLSFYHALYFPERFDRYFNAGVFFEGCSATDIAHWKHTVSYLYHKLSLAQPGRRLLIKNPVYTSRVSILREIWPKAKFIHIHRNPYKVFISMRNFYSRLFEQFAMQDWHGIDIDEVIYVTYARMMQGFCAQTAGLQEDRFIELQFSAFQRDPLAQIHRIYDQLGLEGFDTAQAGFREYLASVGDYRKNKYQYSDGLIEEIGQRWQPFIEQWNYSAPA
ncbi:MAG: sulfotransferase [Pseudomonadota bacterium]